MIPDDARTDFAACWARLCRQWLLPSDPTQPVELTVADLQAGMMELFSAGGVHHVAQARKIFDKLAEYPGHAWQAIEAAYGGHLADVDTELEDPKAG